MMAPHQKAISGTGRRHATKSISGKYPPGAKPPTTTNIKKKRSYKPGMAALREIRNMQKSADLVIPKAPFTRLVREIMADVSTNAEYRIQAVALEALQEAAEIHLVKLFQCGNLCALHSRRVTIMPKDFYLTKSICDIMGVKGFEGNAMTLQNSIGRRNYHASESTSGHGNPASTSKKPTKARNTSKPKTAPKSSSRKKTAGKAPAKNTAAGKTTAGKTTAGKTTARKTTAKKAPAKGPVTATAAPVKQRSNHHSLGPAKKKQKLSEEHIHDSDEESGNGTGFGTDNSDNESDSDSDSDSGKNHHHMDIDKNGGSDDNNGTGGGGNSGSGSSIGNHLGGSSHLDSSSKNNNTGGDAGNSGKGNSSQKSTRLTGGGSASASSSHKTPSKPRKNGFISLLLDHDSYLVEPEDGQCWYDETNGRYATGAVPKSHLDRGKYKKVPITSVPGYRNNTHKVGDTFVEKEGSEDDDSEPEYYSNFDENGESLSEEQVYQLHMRARQEREAAGKRLTKSQIRYEQRMLHNQQLADRGKLMG